jgi:small conductance mechanosensitive channel
MNESRLSALLISGGLIVALAVLGLAVVQLFIKRALNAVQSMKHLREARRQQLATLIYILQWVARLFIVGAAGLMLLSHFGIDITPLLASAGVAGLAISLGAQTLIKDLIGGFLVLSENQYVVGDFIQVGNVSGQVEQLTLRATHVRDANGNLHLIPNGEVRVVANQTKGWSRALVDVGVAYEEDLERVFRILDELAASFAQDPTFGPQLLEPPQVLGPMSLGDWAITLRVMVKTLPGKQWAVNRELQRRINDVFMRENVTSPYPRQEIWVRGLDEGQVHTKETL